VGFDPSCQELTLGQDGIVGIHRKGLANSPPSQNNPATILRGCEGVLAARPISQQELNAAICRPSNL
jgi:hypothetical protein